MKKFVKISDKFSPLLARGGSYKVPMAANKPLGIPVLPGAPLMPLQHNVGRQQEGGTFSTPSLSCASRNVAVASSEHCIGYTVLGDENGVQMQAESYLELGNLYVMNAKLNVVSMREQVKFAFGFDNEKPNHHIFDLVVDIADGSRIAIAVKPRIRLVSGRFIDEMQTVAWWVRELDFADETRIVTDADVHPVDWRNASLFAAVRGEDPEADAAALDVAQSLTPAGARSIKDLTDLVGLGHRGYRAILRLLRSGYLTTLARVEIKPSMIVQRADLTLGWNLSRQRMLVANEPQAIRGTGSAA